MQSCAELPSTSAAAPDEHGITAAREWPSVLKRSDEDPRTAHSSHKGTPLDSFQRGHNRHPDEHAAAVRRESEAARRELHEARPIAWQSIA
jgi:hypothetical protein